MKTCLDAFWNSDAAGKLIVLILMVFSAWVWSIMANKLFSVTSVRSSCNHFRKVYQGYGATPLRIIADLETHSISGPLAELCKAAIDEIGVILGLDSYQMYAMRHDGLLPRKVTDAEIDKIRATLDRVMNSQSLMLEDQLSILGSLISISPMLGLFGTVWGVMATFIGIVNAGGRPDIAAIAPGISGALLTTVAGLIVAIPSLVGNNFIIGYIQKTDVEMDIFIEEFITSLKVMKIAAPASPAPAGSPAPAAPLPHA